MAALSEIGFNRPVIHEATSGSIYIAPYSFADRCARIADHPPQRVASRHRRKFKTIRTDIDATNRRIKDVVKWMTAP